MVRRDIGFFTGWFSLCLATLSFAQASGDLSAIPGTAVSDATQTQTNPAKPASEGDSLPAYGPDYLYSPPSTHPLNSLLPQGGIDQHPAWGYLKIPERNIINRHEVDFESREVRIHSLYYNIQSKNSTNLWTAYYQELATYTFDMYDVGLRRLWLSSLIGQKDAGSTAIDGSLFDIAIPVNMPAWMKDLGLDKPKLQLTGQMNIRLHGYGEYDDSPGSSQKSLWPSPSLSYEPSFQVKGKIGRNITVEVDNTESGLGVRNQIRVIYAEATPGEFEDYILQRLELGSTSLSLKGTELTGYSENHQGLFGVKADFKIGDWKVTTIASQDGGSSEKYTLRSSEESTEYEIADRQFVSYKYYFLNHNYRDSYIEKAIGNKTTSLKKLSGLTLYKRAPSNTTSGVLDDITAYYVTPDNDTIKESGLRLVEVDDDNWSWDQDHGILQINSASKNTLIVATWDNDGYGNKSGLSDGGKAVLIQFDKTGASLPDISDLMLRNVYNVGLSSSTTSSFILRMKNKNKVSVSYLKTLGIVDSSSGSPNISDNDIFPKNSSTGEYTGEMWLPCKTTSWYKNNGYASTSSAAKEKATNNCLEPLRTLDTTGAISKLYTATVSNLTASKYTSQFYFETVGKQRKSSISVRDASSSYSVSSGNCSDIAEGSEKLKVGSDVLVRGVDYDVNYELGQIELISEKALNPNNEITITYECTPLFEIDNKILLGARAEYPLTSISENSLIGLTALYKSQSTTKSQPNFGGEPFNSTLLGANIALQDSAHWMDRFINSWPFIDTKAKSQWSAQGEVAASYHNINTSARKEALVEDFESTTRAIQYSTYRTYWYQASPPGGISSDATTYISDLDFKHQGEFIWHSNQSVRYRTIYPETGNSDVDTKEMTLLKFTLKPNDNLEGKSWGGVMRANSEYNQDLTDMRYLEVVARGNVGNLYIEFGAMSEDVAVDGYEPNGELNSETAAGSTTPLNDYGLDGLTGSAESRVVWDCRTDDCDSSIISGTTTANSDVARDDFSEQEDDTDPDVHINGTEDNNGSGEHPYDSEDLDRNGTLDEDIRYVRYRVNLEDENITDYEELKNGWRRWRIQLTDYDSIVASDGSSLDDILADARMTRVWYGRLKHSVSEGQVQIAELNVVGNQWTSDSTGNQYGVVVDGPTQTVTVDGSAVEVTVPGQTIVADTNYLNVSVINNRDDASSYYKSPNTVTERDAETNAALKEQSLVLDFGGLHPGQAVAATRVLDDALDLSQYKRLKMEIHLTSDQDSIPVRFALQFGYGGSDGSSNYYEWSFRPSVLRCGSSDRTADCHESNWLANAMDMALSDFTDLKDGRKSTDAPKEHVLTSDSAVARDERVRIVGNPSITNVNWIRFVVQAEDSATLNELEPGGTFWIDDLRLAGISNSWGYAGRAQGQLNFADVMSLSAEVKYQDGNFATLSSDGSSPKPTLSEANTDLKTAANLNLNVNKFFKDEWSLHMPLSLGYSSEVKRPYLIPESDVALSEDNLADVASDYVSGDVEITDSAKIANLRAERESKGYQSFSRTRTLSFGYTKDHTPEPNLVKDIAKQAFLERPSFNYRYSETEALSATAGDSSYSYASTIDYRLGTYKPFNFHPIQSMPKLTLEPWPQTFDLTLFDFSYNKTIAQELDPNFVEPQTDKITNYSVVLKHKLNMRWNITPFLGTSYSLNITRDLDGNNDWKSFTKENFFSSSDNGLFANGVIFDYDHTDRKVYSSYDSTDYEVTEDEDEREVKVVNGDTVTIVDGDTSTYIAHYDTTYAYKVDSVGSRDYGRTYGILRDERARSQDFKINFNPVFPILPFKSTFGSSFQQNKTIPDDYDPYDEDMLTENYWSINQNNSFDFSPTLKLIDLFGFGHKNVATDFLEKLRWREIKFNWNVNLKTTGENFTLAQLYEDQHVSPLQYYLYGLGLGNGRGMRSFWDLVSGDIDLTRDDYMDFAEYRSTNVDTLVYQGSFSHSIVRKASASTGLTLPIWNIGVTTDLLWQQSLEQDRETPLQLDTTTIWPKIGVGITVPNFANRINFLKTHFRSVSLNHRTEYTHTRAVHPFQTSQDVWTDLWNFNPLLGIKLLTKKNVHIDNDITFSWEYDLGRPKVQVITEPGWPDESAAETDTGEYFLDVPWMHTDSNIVWTTKFGDDLSISYDLKTKHGFQFFKWYFRMKNAINLKLGVGFSYEKERERERDVVSGYEPLDGDAQYASGVAYTLPYGCDEDDDDCHIVYLPLFEDEDEAEDDTPTRTYEFHIRPSASYQFNKMASASAYVEYKLVREKDSEGDSYNDHILQFDIALLLKFN
ncbi:MAG TPA: cell surface protein SprA [Fibrobacteraceae bacterium]|nr:cell surface protein SprA [Fibrobacteraceae bacterium]